MYSSMAELDNYYDDVGRYALFASVGAIAINMFIIVTASGPDIQTGTDPLHLVVRDSCLPWSVKST